MTAGVKFTHGPKPYQIIQQENGFAKIYLAGTYTHIPPEERTEDHTDTPTVYVSVVREDSSEPVIWWTACHCADGLWEITLDVPAGGLYSIYTSLTTRKNTGWCEWSPHGDIIPHIGVGDLYVIAGQSNSAGYGKDFIYDPPELGVHLYKNAKIWDIATHPLSDSTGIDDNPNREGTTGHSMYLSFAKMLKRELHYPIGLIQTSRGGSRMTWWNPTKEEGVLYRNMKQCIAECGGKFKAIIWYQGESEAMYDDRTAAYISEFDDFHRALVEDFGEDVPLFTFQISYFNEYGSAEQDKRWGTIRQLQREFTKKYKNLYIIPTTDCTMSDHGHVSALSLLRFGELAAKSVLHNLFGKDFMSEAPDLREIQRLDEKTFVLCFDNVYSHLETRISPEGLAIKAEDGGKILSAQSYEILEQNKLKLVFSEPLSKDVVFHGGYTMEKIGVLPFDYATHLPMLSFYGISSQ